MSEYTPTTRQIEDGFAHEPEYEYHNPVGYGAHVQSNRRAFQRWLAEVERAAAEKAWEEGFDAHDKDWAHHDEAGWGDEDCLTDVTTNPYRKEPADD